MKFKIILICILLELINISVATIFISYTKAEQIKNKYTELQALQEQNRELKQDIYLGSVAAAKRIAEKEQEAANADIRADQYKIFFDKYFGPEQDGFEKSKGVRLND